MENYDIGNLKKHYDKLSKEEKTVRLAAFYIILEGRRADIGELSERTSLTREQVESCILKLKKSGALVVDHTSAVVGSHGLSMLPTPHGLHINGRDLFTWCAADAIGIPAAMEADAEIISSCAFCKETIAIKISKGQVVYCSKPEIRLWVVEADLGKPISGCT